MQRTLTSLPIAVVLMFGAVHGAPPPDFHNELVVSGLTEPMAIEFLPDGRMLILEKSGTMRIADPEADPVEAVPYMTLTDVHAGGYGGLLSVTLDPAFDENGFFYLYYHHAPSVRFRVSRFVHTGNSGDASSEFLVWEDPHPAQWVYHVGGGLDFGPDGAIYLATGDEVDPEQAQDLTRAGGKIIRVNPDGSIPPGNPFDDGAGPNIDTIWAYGLRNAFRAFWDLPTERFFIAEVGGNDQYTAWEEVHLAVAGANFGWPLCEGACNNPDFPACDCLQHDSPVFAYPHSGVRASLTGGFVYRGGQYPSGYVGAYFYGDYERQIIRYVTFDATGLVYTGDFDFEPAAGLIVSLVEGADGALYYVDFSGSVRRIRHSPVGDVNGDGRVDVVDLLYVLGEFGPCDAECPPFCLADFDGSCTVDVIDLLAMLGNWSAE